MPLPSLQQTALLLAAVGSGLIAGVFFAFSSFVMPALRKLPPREGLRAMQRINIDVLNWHFLGVFVGTAAFSLATSGFALWNWNPASSPWTLAGGALYLVGTFLVTGTQNVPLNERLARRDPAADDATAEWERYARDWTRWNHVRTAAAVLAMACFMHSL